MSSIIVILVIICLWRNLLGMLLKGNILEYVCSILLAIYLNKIHMYSL